MFVLIDSILIKDKPKCHRRIMFHISVVESNRRQQCQIQQLNLAHQLYHPVI